MRNLLNILMEVLAMKETYRIKPPKHIGIGDPWYYEMYQGNELKNLTIDFLVPRHLSSARVIIEESPLEDISPWYSAHASVHE